MSLPCFHENSFTPQTITNISRAVATKKQTWSEKQRAVNTWKHVIQCPCTFWNKTRANSTIATTSKYSRSSGGFLKAKSRSYSRCTKYPRSYSSRWAWLMDQQGRCACAVAGRDKPAKNTSQDKKIKTYEASDQRSNQPSCSLHCPRGEQRVNIHWCSYIASRVRQRGLLQTAVQINLREKLTPSHWPSSWLELHHSRTSRTRLMKPITSRRLSQHSTLREKEICGWLARILLATLVPIHLKKLIREQLTWCICNTYTHNVWGNVLSSCQRRPSPPDTPPRKPQDCQPGTFQTTRNSVPALVKRKNVMTNRTFNFVEFFLQHFHPPDKNE